MCFGLVTIAKENAPYASSTKGDYGQNMERVWKRYMGSTRIMPKPYDNNKFAGPSAHGA